MPTRHPSVLIASALAACSLQAHAQTADEVRAIVAEAVADAESRSSLLQSRATSGHDGRFFIASPDGAFRLNVGGLVQFRYYANFRDDDNTAGLNPTDDFEPGFQTARTRLNFAGNIINRDWFYKIETQFARDDGEAVLLDAFAGYDFGNGFGVQWGQFEFAFSREENINPGKYLAVDQSVVNAVFTQGYSQGVQARYQSEAWRVFAGFSDGLRSANTDILDAAEADYALNGRFEYKFAGDWNQFEDFTALRGGDFGALLGAAVFWQQSANTNQPTDVDTDYLGYTADLHLEGDAWNIYVAGHGRHLESSGPIGNPNEPESDDFGALAQGGYRVLEDTELFARWDAIFLDDDATVGTNDDDNFNFVTVGVNQYIAGHAAKFTADVVWSIDETAPLINSGIGGFTNTGLGYLGTSTNSEVVIRLQFQLVF